jgi:hypothetical protein
VFVLLPLALVIGLLIARLRGGSLSALGRIRVRAPWLALGVVAGITLAALAPGLSTPGWLLAAVCAGLLCAANQRIPGLTLLFVGLALNAIVIIANHDRMPVSRSALRSAGVSEARLASSEHDALAGPGTVLRQLGDVIPFPFWGAPSVLSAGDVLLVSGVGLFAALAPVRASRSLRARRTRRERRRPPARDDDGTAADDDLAEPGLSVLAEAPAAGQPVGAVLRSARTAASRTVAATTADAPAATRRGTMAAGPDGEQERGSQHGEEEA